MLRAHEPDAINWMEAGDKLASAIHVDLSPILQLDVLHLHKEKNKYFLIGSRKSTTVHCTPNSDSVYTLT